ncbi:hypothetical protein SteCoe_8273 [Stentor coeruleus]|uniref:Uncharacterized protein n=1 Tax=Stentor coeruleus TaxID=5963 RepID=A0A1R2CKM2_9CILI|nr:hypothetical protein SteCoe_8273 [Stentor coeruleus]
MDFAKKSKLNLLNSHIKQILLKVIYYWKGTCGARNDVRKVKKVEKVNRTTARKKTDNPMRFSINYRRETNEDFIDDDFLKSCLSKASVTLTRSTQNSKQSTTLFDEIKASLKTKAQNNNLKETPEDVFEEYNSSKIQPENVSNDPLNASRVLKNHFSINVLQKQINRVIHRRAVTELSNTLAVVSTKYV